MKLDFIKCILVNYTYIIIYNMRVHKSNYYFGFKSDELFIN